MKKYGWLFLAIFIAVVISPLLAKAEVKTFDGYKYTIEEASYKDYLCDKSSTKQYRFFTNFDNTKVVLSVINEAPIYQYLIDFTKNNNCETIDDSKYEEMFPNTRYSYFWGKDNIVRRVKWTYDDERYFILTEDNTISKNKIYFELNDITFTEVETPNEDLVATYYEEIYLSNALDYDANAIYYKQNSDTTITKVGQLTKEEFENDFYYTKVSNLETEEILTLNHTSFIVPKETLIFGEDYKYDRSDTLEVTTIDGKTYLQFVEENLGAPVVFDLDGSLVKFGFDKIMSPENFEVTKNNNINLTIGPTFNELKMYIMDSSFNILYEKEYNDDFIGYLTSIDNTDYFVLDSHIDPGADKKIIKVIKEKNNENGAITDNNKSSEIDNPNTLDNITTSIIIGAISLVGLIILIVYLRKKKSTKS